ncbi:hypothetical protein [Floccifex sp.]|uniref:hypothetical protein n=1 Tax=Floccifex sp. TaxID=2815810 RepID=UPI002A747FAD|nr:hypothetical protein [Floccifex sp.]MDD7281129.1 hypothetical protein [Erysipelotrichaceae bacterium]MDY2957794.1 hypothetical protein [Floccifex sp.]
MNKKEIFEKYNNKTHFYGRICTVICLALFIAVPFVMGFILDAMPDLSAVGKCFLSVGLVYIVSCIAEYLIYTPMLGAGGTYLAFITGNLINMKIPCAMTSRDIVQAKAGSEESEIIATLSIATSSLVTIVVIALGVLLMIPLQPILQSPVLQPAFDNVVPALFGAMAYKYYRSNLKVAGITLMFVSLLFVLVPSLLGSVSFIVIPSGAIAIGLTLYSHMKGNKK